MHQTEPIKPPILIVEDSPDQWFVIRWALLNRFPEVEPHWAASTDQALAYLKTCAQAGSGLPRLILLDLYLPQREQGWALLHSLKLHHLYREIPVVMLSYSSLVEDIQESYMFRANSYMTKPGSYEQWLECFAIFRHYWWGAVTLPV